MAAPRMTGRSPTRIQTSGAASSPHQVLFVLAGTWAIMAVVVPVLGGTIGADVASWHAQEMVFGFGGAAFSGYALTAMRSWSEDNRISRRNMALLTGLWLLARASAWGWPAQGTLLATAAGAAFPAAIAAILTRAAWRSGRGSPLAIFAVLLTALQIAISAGGALPRDGVQALALLLSLVGGRMVAAFTGNATTQPALGHRLARLLATPAAIATGLALVLSMILPGQSKTCSILLIIAAIAEAVRLLLWQTPEVWHNRLLTMLHLAYLWQVIGLALLGLARWPGSSIAEATALHALAAGAVSCSVYSVAARAVARRADVLRAEHLDFAGFVLLWIAAALRVFGPADWMHITAAIWCAAWAVFLARHGAALLRSPPRPVFSGPRRFDR